MKDETAELVEMIHEWVKLPSETEFVEFKRNFHSPEEIGTQISALANSACLHKQEFGYLIFGIEDRTHDIVGTTFKPKSKKVKGVDLELWLTMHLNPKIDFSIKELVIASGIHLVVFVVPAAINQPVKFEHKSYIRINSITKMLLEYPDKEAKIWASSVVPFEKQIAKTRLDASDITRYLSTNAYFDLLSLPYPSNLQAVIDKFIEEGLVVKKRASYEITNLGAILFAKSLADFPSIEHKQIRVIVYKGKNKIETERESIFSAGYALDFKNAVEWVNGQLPANEEIGKALRTETRMYPEIAIRELIANLLVHQDFSERGSPMIEIFSDRIEFTNPGVPLIDLDRFIDNYLSRNDKLASLMRRLGFCEEKGSGIDKVFFYVELYQLPPLQVFTTQNHTRVSIFSYKDLKDLDRKNRILACYQHACLKYISSEKMTNQSLRDRFKIDARNYAVASRIIKDALEDEVIKVDDPESKSKKFASYLPFWA